MVTPAAKWKAVAHRVDTHGMSERRARKAISCKTGQADDACLRQRMRSIAQEHRRFGYRRLLKREGLRLEAPIAATVTRTTLAQPRSPSGSSFVLNCTNDRREYSAACAARDDV